MEKATKASKINSTDIAAYRNQVLALLEHQKIMVLAVQADDRPWAAPVYYLYEPPGLYFFSSSRSKHIQSLRKCRQTACAIFADSDRWQDIQGLQMSGQVNEVRSKIKALHITTRYLAKFPLARELMSSRPGKAKNINQNVQLFVFLPTEIHCTNNQLGFGRRVRIDI